MKLLTDKELEKELTKQNPMIEKIPLPPGGDWFAAASAIQPSSIDLHIGQIFLPEKREGKPGSETKPLLKYTLKSGHTAVVITKEFFSLPDDFAGIGFPPDSVSSQGILMTNPGHIDPGYKGSLRFTLINMGREPFSLKAGDAIVTVLLFELEAPVKSGYAARHPGQISGVKGIQDTLNNLSADFVDVERRAERIAKSRVAKAALWAATVPAILSGIIALITAFAVSWFSPSWKDPIQEIRKDIAVLQTKADSVDLKTDLRVLQNKTDPTELKNQIRDLRRQIPKSNQGARHE
jgi:deoxycytidine triphosphate deaminase